MTMSTDFCSISKFKIIFWNKKLEEHFPECYVHRFYNYSKDLSFLIPCYNIMIYHIDLFKISSIRKTLIEMAMIQIFDKYS